MSTFNRNNLPEDLTEYVRKGTVRAKKIETTFTVAGRYGVSTVDGGYLVVDEGGWPTAVTEADFEATHEAK